MEIDKSLKENFIKAAVDRQLSIPEGFINELIAVRGIGWELNPDLKLCELHTNLATRQPVLEAAAKLRVSIDIQRAVDAVLAEIGILAVEVRDLFDREYTVQEFKEVLAKSPSGWEQLDLTVLQKSVFNFIFYNTDKNSDKCE